MLSRAASLSARILPAQERQPRMPQPLSRPSKGQQLLLSLSLPSLSANNRPPSALQVREEIITNVQATYKETDLFKMFQTGDLANLDALPPEQAAKLASVFRLRQAIYSPDFRSFISQVTGGW